MTVKNMDTQNTPTAFDPLAWATQQPTAACKKPIASSQEPTACQPLSPDEELAKATAVARELMERGANIADDYHDYVKLGFALVNGLGSQGHGLYHMLCSASPKYRTADCERKWNECMRKADGRTSIATFYHMARQAGVDISAISREQNRKHHSY